MRTLVTSALAALCLTGAPAMLAAPQRSTSRPGELTEGHVWIDNRGRTQAIPVDRQQTTLDGPLRVRVVNGDANGDVNTPLLVRVVRPV
jgi:hypothetical protein